MHMSYVAIFLVLALSTAPSAGVYFNRMMSCEQFCQMLTKDYVRQVWCVIGICRKQKLYRNVVKYAKRGGYRGRNPVNEFDSLKAAFATKSDLPLSSVFAKRVKEFWTGPTPADQ